MESGYVNYKSRLQTLFYEIAMGVVYVYFELKILESGNLFLFLHENIHVLFHKHVSTIPCCKCPKTSLAALNKQSSLDSTQFQMLFECIHTGEHEQISSGKIKQYCLCKFSPNKSLQINDMDFTLLYKLIKSCCTSYAGHPKWLEDIYTIRNYLSHLGATEPTHDEFKDKWTSLETSTLEIAKTVAHTYHYYTRRQIEDLKKNDNIVDDLSKVINQKSSASKEEIKDLLLACLADLHIKIDELSFHATRTGFSAPATSEDDRIPVSATHPREDVCVVTWKFVTQGPITAEEMKEKLNHFGKILSFNIEFVYIGCLTIITTISKDFLSNAELFKEEVIGFIKEVVHKCGIDTTIKAEIPFEIFLTTVGTNEKDNNGPSISDNLSQESSAICTVCKEKDDEIKALQENLNKQLEKEYKTIDMRQKTLSSIFDKNSHFDKSLDDFISALENEMKLDQSVSLQLGIDSDENKPLDDLYKEFKIETESDVVISDVEIQSQYSETSDDNKDSPLHSETDVREIRPDVRRSYDFVDDYATTEGDTAGDAKLEVRIKGRKPKCETSLFLKCASFDIDYDTHVYVTGIGLTEDGRIIMCNVCSEQLLIYSQDGQWLENCFLEAYPWTISMCQRTGEGVGANHSGVVSVPEKQGYQYLSVTSSEAVKPSYFHCVGFNCYGIKMTDDHVIVGGNNTICILNRDDEAISSIEIYGVVLCLDIYLEIKSVEIKEIDENYSDEIFKHKIVYLNDQNSINFVSFPDDSLYDTKEETGSEPMISLNISDQQDGQTIYGMAVGHHNDVYLTSNSTDDLYKWDTSVKLCRVLGFGDKIVKPTMICFSENYDKMYVATNNGKTMTVWNNTEYVDPRLLDTKSYVISNRTT